MVYGNGLENRRGVKATESSNLSLSAKKNDDPTGVIFLGSVVEILTLGRQLAGVIKVCAAR